MMSRKQRAMWGGLMLAAAGLFFVCLGIASVYAYSPFTTPARVLAHVLPLPVASVNGEWVKLRDVHVEYDLVSTVSPEANPDMLAGQVIDGLINKMLVSQLARTYELDVSADQVGTMRAELIQEGFEEMSGWSTAVFDAHVVRPITLFTVLKEFVAENNEIQSESRRRAEEVVRKLNAGESFERLAGENEEISLAAAGGDVGIVSMEELSSEWQSALKDIEEEGYTSVIETPEAFSVLWLKERLGEEEDVRLHLAVISIKKQSLSSVVDAFTTESTVKRFVQF